MPLTQLKVKHAIACLTFVFSNVLVQNCYADSSFRVITKDTTASILIELLEFNDKKIEFYKMFCLEFGKRLQARYSDLRNLPILIEIQHQSKSETIRFLEHSFQSSKEHTRELVVSVSIDELFYSDLKGLGEVSVRIDERDPQSVEVISSSSIRLMNTLSEIKSSIQSVNDFFVLLSNRSANLRIKEYRSFDSAEVSRTSSKLEILK